MRAEDNELLTQTGPGTPMGELMRQYWFPALKSSELEAGGAPVRLRLMGENFIAFRSPDGTVGVLDHRCPHRCASFFYGRNESGGIRCVYHGWKFDAEGRCVEQPNEPPETQFKDKVRARALRTAEKNQVIWVYMGERATPPPLPKFDIDDVPEDKLVVQFLFRECNWLQAFEGDIDTCHVGFLHTGGASAEMFEPGSLAYHMHTKQGLAPKYEAIETPYGTMYNAYRAAGEDQTSHRIGHFIFPFYTMAPDEHSMLVMIKGEFIPPPLPRDKDGNVLPGGTIDLDYYPNTTDWYGRWRIKHNPRNDHMISRERQRTGNFSGIDGIQVQDQAITESMGPIVDRTYEHLGTSDQMIARTRRRLIMAARDHIEKGVSPPVVEQPDLVRGVRSGNFVRPSGVDWLETFNEYRKQWYGDKAPDLIRPKSRTSQVA